MDGPLDFNAHSHSRRASLRAVLREVIRTGGISRAELSRRTGLSKQTTSEIMRDLLEGKWVREVGLQRGHIGRSATNYELNGRRAFVWGGDLGGTNLRIAIADLSGEVIAEAKEPTVAEGGRAVITQIRDMVRRLASEQGLPADHLACGALGVPGSYDRRRGRLRLVSNIAGMEELSLEEDLSAALDMTVFVENDVTLAAKGELWRGDAPESGSFAFLAMGTGVGLGLVSEGAIVRGAHGAAGEIAWLPVAGDPFDLRNFRRGTLESAISSAAILERFQASTGLDISMVELFDRHVAGEPMATALLDEVARALAQAVLSIWSVFDPETVIFGGSIGARKELITLVRGHLARCMVRPVPITASKLGNGAGQIGAIGMAVDHFHETLFLDGPS